MKLKYQIIQALFFCLVFSDAQAQAKSDESRIMELFAKSKKAYEENKTFKMDISYRLFPSYKSTVVTEKYDGVIIGRNKDFYSKIGTTEFINSKGATVKIDNDSKLIEFGQKETEQPVAYDLTGFVSNFNHFELASSGDYWVCTLTSPEITFVPYSKVVVAIHKTNYTISKQVLYLLVESKYKTKSGKVASDYPRMEIVFSNFQTQAVEVGTKLNIETYISQKNKKVTPSKNYKNYKVVN